MGETICFLRILGSDEPKNSKNEQLLDVLPDKDGVLTEL